MDRIYNLNSLRPRCNAYTKMNTMVVIDGDKFMIIDDGLIIKENDFVFIDRDTGFKPIHPSSVGSVVESHYRLIIRPLGDFTAEKSEHEKMVDFFFKKSYHSGLR